MQDVIYRDLDKAAPKDKEGESPQQKSLLTNEGISKAVQRLQEIQDAYRDRARAMLSTSQRVKADSLEKIWRGTDLLKKDAPPIKPIPPPLG